MAAKPCNVKQTLEAALKLLKGGKRWCRGSLAQDKDYTSVSPRQKDAYQFCAIGAMRHVDGKFEVPATRLLRQVARNDFHNCVEAINDWDPGKFGAVAKLFRIAIAQAGRRK